MRDIKIECGVRNGSMVCTGYCRNPIDLRIEDEIETILKDSIMIIANNSTINMVNNVNILFEGVENDVIDDVYKLSVISNDKTISFKVKVSTDQTSTHFPKSHCINLFDTGQKIGTQELVFTINAFFHETQFKLNTY